MAKIRMKKPAEAVTLRDAFREFTTAQTAKGVKDKTLQTYASHFKSAERHLNMDSTFSELTKADLDSMIVFARGGACSQLDQQLCPRNGSLFDLVLWRGVRHFVAAELQARGNGQGGLYGRGA